MDESWAYWSDSEVEWFKNWFNEDYLLVYGSRNRLAAEQEINALAGWSGLSSARRVLDLGCGAGRHLPILARYSSTVTGVDLSPVLLDFARSELRTLDSSIGDRIRLVNADIRALPFEDASFDFLCSLFTSFGYLESDEAHLALLCHWHRLLQRSGSLLIDCINPAYLRNHLEAETRRVESGIEIIEERHLNLDTKRVEKTIRLTPPDASPRSYRESVRLFSVPELEHMIAQAGFLDLRFAGDYEGRTFSDESERLILLAHTESRS